MDQQTLQELREKVKKADELQQQIEVLEEFIGSCNADIGFLNITMNYRQQNEIKLVNKFPQRDIFDAFKNEVHDAAVALKHKLEVEFRNLK